jgi:hypothetical protein
MIGEDESHDDHVGDQEWNDEREHEGDRPDALAAPSG